MGLGGGWVSPISISIGLFLFLVLGDGNCLWYVDLAVGLCGQSGGLNPHTHSLRLMARFFYARFSGDVP